MNWKGKKSFGLVSIALGLLLSTGIAAAGDVDRVANCVAASDGVTTRRRNSGNRLNGEQTTSSDGQESSKTSATKYELVSSKKTDTRANRAGAESFQPMLQNCFDLD